MTNLTHGQIVQLNDLLRQASDLLDDGTDPGGNEDQRALYLARRVITMNMSHLMGTN